MRHPISRLPEHHPPHPSQKKHTNVTKQAENSAFGFHVAVLLRLNIQCIDKYSCHTLPSTTSQSTKRPIKMSNITLLDAHLPVCAFDGNADLYGIGIRTGFYLQWITTLLTTLFAPSDEEILRILNLLLQSAIFTGLILLTVRQQIHAIEPVISIWLIFGALSSLSGSGMNPLGRFSGFYRISLYSAVAAYATWFWFVGLDGLLKPDCKPIAFFGKVSISGRFRTFNKVASVAGLAVCGGFMLLCIMAFVKRRNKSKKTKKVRKPKRQQVVIEFLFLSTMIIAVSIWAVEYLLKENEITNINETLSVGQLIPLLVGGISFVAIIPSAVSGKFYRRPMCWVLFGRHLS